MVINLKQQKLTFNNKPIGVIQRTNAVEQSLLGVAAEAEKLSNIALQEMKLASTEAGEKAARTMPMEKFYTLNADGDFEAYDTKEFQDLGTNAQRAFKTLANKKFMRSIQKDMEIKHKELALKYKDTVGGDELYANVFGQYIDTLVDNSPAEFKDIIRNDGIDTLQLGKTNIQANLRTSSNIASMRMIEEEMVDLASKYAKAAGDPELQASIRLQMENVVQSSQLLENTFSKARELGLTEKYQRRIDNLDLNTNLANIFSEDGLDKEDVDGINAFFQSSGAYISDKLRNNPEKLQDVREILNGTEGWQMESLFKLSTKYKELTKNILTSSDTTTASSFLEKNNVLSVVNQDIEDTKKTPFSAEKINALSKKFEKQSVDNPKAFPDEKMRSKKAQLAAAAVVRLGDEILQISDAEGNALPSGAWRKILGYLDDGREDNLNFYPNIKGEEVPFDLATKKAIINFKKQMDSTDILDSARKQVINRRVSSYLQNKTNIEATIQRNIDKKANELELQEKREELLDYSYEMESIKDNITRNVKSEEDVEQAVKDINNFIDRFSSWATKSGGKNVGQIVISDKGALEKVLGQRINQIITSNVAQLVALEPNVKTEQGLAVLNSEKLDDLKQFLNFIRNPADKLREKINEKYLAEYDKYYNRDDIQLDDVRTNLTTGISQILALAVNEQSNKQEILNYQNDANAVLRHSAKRDEKASKMVDDLLFNELKIYSEENNLGLIDKNKTIQENMKDFYSSEESLELNPVRQLMYGFIKQGYLPHQFVDLYNMMGGADEKTLKVLDTHRMNLMNQPGPDGRKLSVIGYKGTNKFAGNYGFKSINDSFRELASINAILKFRAGGNQQAFGLIDNANTGHPLEETAVEVPTDFPYSDILNGYSQISNDDINDALGILMKQLKIKTLYEPSNANREIIVKDLINSTEIFGPASDNKNALSLFQPPQEIMDITENFFVTAMMDSQLRNDKKGLKQYYNQYKELLTEYMETNYVESKGNVLDFTNMHTLSTTHTRLHPALHLGEERYYALVDYVNDRLPDDLYFDFDATQTDTFLKKFQFSRQNIPTDEIYSGMEKDPNLAYYMEGDRLASEFAGELKSGQDISQEIFKRRLAEDLKEKGIGKVVLVAYETAMANEIIYQAMRVTKNESLAPVMVTNTKGDTIPFVFSLGSLSAAFDKDGVYEEIFRNKIQSGVDRRQEVMND
tara:strand:- start:6743 stop:10357 length:3615 start_codon:yes stop_codon:yes gene_type:complete